MSGSQPLVKQVDAAGFLLSIALNTIGMRESTPLVSKEAIANSTTRVGFETHFHVSYGLSCGIAILMYNSDHIGALQDAAIPLRQTINEGDRDSFQAALARLSPMRRTSWRSRETLSPPPSSRESRGLTELSILCTTGQPCARIYRSTPVAAAQRKP